MCRGGDTEMSTTMPGWIRGRPTYEGSYAGVCRKIRFKHHRIIWDLRHYLAISERCRLLVGISKCGRWTGRRMDAAGTAGRNVAASGLADSCRPVSRWHGAGPLVRTAPPPHPTPPCQLRRGPSRAAPILSRLTAGHARAIPSAPSSSPPT